MEGMEQMKRALEKEGSKAGNDVNNTEQGAADMVTVGRSETMEQGTSKGLKRKLGAQHKVLIKTMKYMILLEHLCMFLGAG